MTAPIPGLSLPGTSIPLHGRLRNIAATELTRQTAGVTWAYQPSSSAPARVLAYVDGQLRSITDPASGGVDINNVGVGDSSAQFVTVSEFASPLPRQVDPLGQNALLSWPPSSSSDCVAYRIYLGSELVGIADIISAEERINALPDIGAGNGRITVWGRVPDYHGTVTGTLTVTGAGIAEWDCPGFPIAEIEFSQSTVLTLQPGFSVNFHDDSDLYVTGDSWTITVGPECYYITDTLAPGTYTFDVVAVDAAGNESSPVASQSIFIPLLPDPIIADMSYTGGTLTVSWDAPANSDGVNVYTNFNPHTNTFEPYVNTDGLPYAVITGESWSFTPPSGVEGRLLFYLRPYNSTAERDDGVLRGFSFPPEPGDVGVNIEPPTGIVATPTAGGTWRLEWDYRLFPDSNATGFNIYRDGVLLTTVPLDAGVGVPIIHYTYNHTTPESSAVTLLVRTTDGTTETTNTDAVTLTPDATPPVFVGPVTGGPA